LAAAKVGSLAARKSSSVAALESEALMGRLSPRVLALSVLVCQLAIHTCGQAPAEAPSPALGSSIPVVNIPANIDLPTLPILQNFVTLTMAPARITVRTVDPYDAADRAFITPLSRLASSSLRLSLQGPGANTTNELPYVSFTGRLLNDQLVAGVLRVQQGTLCLITVDNCQP
jgi:hypothetical protein